MLIRHKETKILASKVSTGRPDSQCPKEWIKSRADVYVDMSTTMSKDPSVSDPQKWQGLPLVRIQMVTVCESIRHGFLLWDAWSLILFPCRETSYQN